MNNERTVALAVSLLGAAATLGCSGGGAVNIGNTETKGSQLSDYAASWDGYAEAYTFSPDGSDRVRLSIDPTGQGTLQIGDGALIAPPTDPNSAYPPDATTADNPLLDMDLAARLNEGFLYPLHAAQVQTDRIQLGLDPGDLYSSWCALETSVPQTDGTDGGPLSYNCLPNEGFNYDPSTKTCSLNQPDGGTVPVGCGKLLLCELDMVCACTADACTSKSVAAGTPVNQYPIEIDGALDATGSTLTGTLLLDSSTRVTVVLQKK